MTPSSLSVCFRRAVVVGALTLAAAAPLGAQNKYQPLINRWVEQDMLNPQPANAALFVGSSSVRRWESLAFSFSNRNVIQRGFGGSTWDDAIEFVDEIVLAYDPAVIFVFEGSNDITQGKSAAAAFADYQTFVNLVHTGQNQSRPPIPIVQISLTPAPGLWSSWSTRSQYNTLVKAYTEGDPALFYADTATPMLATGSPPSESLFAPDLVHLNENGYAIWTAVMTPLVHALAPAQGYVPNPQHPPAGRRIMIDLGPDNFADGEHAPDPDVNGNSWFNWHSVDGLTSSSLNAELAGQVFAGEHKANLITVRGEPTGIDLTITGGFATDGKQFGGLLSPSTTLLKRFAVAEATQDFFFSTGYKAPGGFVLDGLNPNLRYDFRFFGSRAANEPLTTIFGVSGRNGNETTASTVVSGSGVGAGGYAGNNDTIALVEAVAPDARGRAFVDIRGAAGGDEWALLNALEIWIRPPDRPKPFGGGPSTKP